MRDDIHYNKIKPSLGVKAGATISPKRRRNTKNKCKPTRMNIGIKKIDRADCFD